MGEGDFPEYSVVKEDGCTCSDALPGAEPESAARTYPLFLRRRNPLYLKLF